MSASRLIRTRGASYPSCPWRAANRQAGNEHLQPRTAARDLEHTLGHANEGALDLRRQAGQGRKQSNRVDGQVLQQADKGVQMGNAKYR